MKNKILTISIIFILLSFIFINNCFAIQLDNFTENYYFFLPDTCYNTLITLDEYNNDNYNFFSVVNNGTFEVYFFDKSLNIKFKVTRSDSNNYGQYCITNMDDLSNFSCKAYYIGEKSGSINKTSTLNYFAIPNSMWNYYTGYSKKAYLYTNLEFYSVDNSNDFFFNAPVTETTLAQELEKIQVQEMWKTLMKNVVISLLAFVVSYLALRKAWSFLRIQLKGS